MSIIGECAKSTPVITINDMPDEILEHIFINSGIANEDYHLTHINKRITSIIHRRVKYSPIKLLTSFRNIISSGNVDLIAYYYEHGSYLTSQRTGFNKVAKFFVRYLHEYYIHDILTYGADDLNIDVLLTNQFADACIKTNPYDIALIIRKQAISFIEKYDVFRTYSAVISAIDVINIFNYTKSDRAYTFISSVLKSSPRIGRTMIFIYAAKNDMYDVVDEYIGEYHDNSFNNNILVTGCSIDMITHLANNLERNKFFIDALCSLDICTYDILMTLRVNYHNGELNPDIRNRCELLRQESIAYIVLKSANDALLDEYVSKCGLTYIKSVEYSENVESRRPNRFIKYLKLIGVTSYDFNDIYSNDLDSVFNMSHKFYDGDIEQVARSLILINVDFIEYFYKLGHQVSYNCITFDDIVYYYGKRNESATFYSLMSELSTNRHDIDTGYLCCNVLQHNGLIEYLIKYDLYTTPEYIYTNTTLRDLQIVCEQLVKSEMTTTNDIRRLLWFTIVASGGIANETILDYIQKTYGGPSNKQAYTLLSGACCRWIIYNYFKVRHENTLLTLRDRVMTKYVSKLCQQTGVYMLDLAYEVFNDIPCQSPEVKNMLCSAKLRELRVLPLL